MNEKILKKYKDDNGLRRDKKEGFELWVLKIIALIFYWVNLETKILHKIVNNKLTVIFYSNFIN